MKEQKALIIRTIKAVADCPLPQAGGSVSSSFDGFVSFAKDMQDMRRPLNSIWQSLAYGEPIDEADVKTVEEISTRSLEPKKVQ